MGQIIRIWYTVKVIVKHNEYGEGPSIQIPVEILPKPMTLKQTITPLKDITISDIFTMADAPTNYEAELVCNP